MPMPIFPGDFSDDDFNLTCPVCGDPLDDAGCEECQLAPALSLHSAQLIHVASALLTGPAMPVSTRSACRLG